MRTALQSPDWRRDEAHCKVSSKTQKSAPPGRCRHVAGHIQVDALMTELGSEFLILKFLDPRRHSKGFRLGLLRTLVRDFTKSSKFNHSNCTPLAVVNTENFLLTSSNAR